MLTKQWDAHGARNRGFALCREKLVEGFEIIGGMSKRKQISSSRQRQKLFHKSQS